MTPRQTPPGNLLAGLTRLVLFNRSGFAAIGSTTQAFLSSLAPLIAFVSVGTVLDVLGLGWRLGLGDGLQTLCVVLGQPVASNLFARLWRREDRWLRYATAMNWCQVAIPVLGAVFLAAAAVFGSASASPRTLVMAAFSAVFVYAVVLNWFLAWRGLDLSPWRAVLFLLAVTGAVSLLLAVPVGLRLAAARVPAAANLAI